MAPWLQYTQSQIEFMDSTELNKLVRKARDFIDVACYEDRQGVGVDVEKLTNARNVHKWAKLELNKRFGKIKR